MSVAFFGTFGLDPFTLLGLGLGIGATAIGIALAVRAGVFSPLRVAERQFGPYALLYVNGRGPYSKVHEHCKRLSCMVVEDARLVPPAEKDLMNSVGFYYDDPNATKPEACRTSFCYVANTYMNNDVSGYVEDMKALSVCKTGELKVAQFPESGCLAIQLPLYGWLSVMTAVFRAYPLLIREARSRLGREQADELLAAGILEVYRPREHTMWVALPLTKRSTMLPF